MKILVIGGGGFIGQNLVRVLLPLGHDVSVLDSEVSKTGFCELHISQFASCNKYSYIKNDATNYFQKAPNLDYDWVVFAQGDCAHLGSVFDPQSDAELNYLPITSFFKVLQSSQVRPRLLYLSTRQVYGKPIYTPVDEKHPIKIVDPNAIHKVAGEQLVELYSDILNLEYFILRLSNIYGPGMRIKDARLNFFGWWINRVINGGQLEIYGDGSLKRDLMYVDDLMYFCSAIIGGDVKSNTIYNVGGSKAMPLTEIADVLTKTSKKISPSLDVSIVYKPIPEDRKLIDIGSFETDRSSIEEYAPLCPNTDLSAGVYKTLNFFRKRKSYYD